MKRYLALTTALLVESLVLFAANANATPYSPPDRGVPQETTCAYSPQDRGVPDNLCNYNPPDRGAPGRTEGAGTR